MVEQNLLKLIETTGSFRVTTTLTECAGRNTGELSLKNSIGSVRYKIFMVC